MSAKRSSAAKRASRFTVRVSTAILLGFGAAAAQERSDQSGTDVASWQPERSVTMIVPFGAGGGSDLLGRTMASGITAVRDNVEIAVENRPGGNGVLGYTYLRQQEGNPHFLLASETAAVALPILIDPPPFHWTDFTPIAQVAADSQLLVVREDSEYQSISDLVAEAKDRTLKVGLTSTTSSDAIVTGLLERNQSVEFQPVILESGANSVARLLNGDIDFTILNPSETIGQMEAGNLRPIAAFSDERYPASTPLADVPTAEEQGVDVSFAQYRGLLAPGGLSQAEADYWADAVEAWTETPSYEKYISDNFLFPRFRRGDEFRAYLEETEGQLEQVLKAG